MTKTIGGYPVEIFKQTDRALLGRRTDTDWDMWEVHVVKPHKTEFYKTGSYERMLEHYNKLINK